MGGNFKFQVQDSDLEFIFFEIWRFKKRITLSEKKPPLAMLILFREYKEKPVFKFPGSRWGGFLGDCEKFKKKTLSPQK